MRGLLPLLLTTAWASNPLFCPDQTVTVTLDFSGLIGKAEDKAKRDMEEAAAWLTQAGGEDRIQIMPGTGWPLAAETCTPPYASFVHGDAATYTSECRYCLAAGDYELHTYDEWGDGWGAGLYTLAMEGCDELHGSQAANPEHHAGCLNAECSVSSMVTFEARHHPSPAPTKSRSTTYEFAVDLDFSAASDPSKRFDAHVAIQSYSRGYGAPTPTGLVGPYLIDGAHPRDPRKAPDVAPCGVDAWWGFDAAVDGDDKKLSADYRFSAGDYALLVRGGTTGWAGGKASVRDADGFEVYVSDAEPGADGTAAYNFTVSHGFPTRTPTWAPRNVQMMLALDWTASTAVASVELYRIDGPSLATPRPTSSMAPTSNHTPTPAPSLKPTRTTSSEIDAGQWLTLVPDIDGKEYVESDIGKRVEREYLVDGADQLLLRLFCSPPLSSAYGTVEVLRGADGAVLATATRTDCAHTWKDFVVDSRALIAPTLSPSPRPGSPSAAPVAAGAPTPSPVIGATPHPTRRPVPHPTSRPTAAPVPRPTASTAAIGGDDGGSHANSASTDLTVLIAALVVVMIVACAAVALAGYTVWKHHKARRDEPTWRDIQRAMEEARNPVYRDVASPKDALEVEGDFEAQPLGVRGSRAWSPLTTEQSRGVELVDLKEDDSPSVDVDLLT
jgi:hypothetical protein